MTFPSREFLYKKHLSLNDMVWYRTIRRWDRPSIRRAPGHPLILARPVQFRDALMKERK